MDRKGRGRGGVEIAIERGRLGLDREAAQHLAGIVPPRRRQLAEHEVARRDPAARGELPRHVAVGRRHRGRADEMDHMGAAVADESALDHAAELVLGHAGPGAADQRRHAGVAQCGADAQPCDLFLGLDEPQFHVVGIEAHEREFRLQRLPAHAAERPDHADAFGAAALSALRWSWRCRSPRPTAPRCRGTSGAPRARDCSTRRTSPSARRAETAAGLPRCRASSSSSAWHCRRSAP